ncbi:MAG: hypothetical protein HDT28_01415 [Clostridiales bacterium]|nr:hypothetical protein [Clostridiales bacterium]
MVKRRFLLGVCILCTLAALLFLPVLTFAKADAVALADDANVIRKSDGTVVAATDKSKTWTYGADNIISYTFRPEHGDTAIYTVSTTEDGQESESFAVVYIGNNAMFYEVKDGVADTEKPFKVNSLNAYLKTLKAGEYKLKIVVPSGTVDSSHTHWWESGTCAVTSYSAATEEVDLKVNAYEFTSSNVGASGSADANVKVKYNILNREVPYSGEKNNLPQVDITFDTDGGTVILVEGEDYTLSSDAVNKGGAELKITGIGGFSGIVTINNAYNITQTENTVSDVFVVRWKYGEYDRNVNLFTANVRWGEENLYFSVTTDIITDPLNPAYVDGLDHIELTDGMVSQQVEDLLNALDAKTTYYLYATVTGNDNYYDAQAHTQFDVVEVTNTWKTIPNVVSWEWHGFDENVNVINAVPAFGDTVMFSVYTKDGNEYTAIKFDGKDSFELEKVEDGTKLPANVVRTLSNLDAGTYYLFASVVSDTVNYSSINENFSADALVPFRVSKATNYWTQIPKISNWSYGNYDPEVNVITAASAHGSSKIKYRIYKQTEDDIVLLSFNGTSSFDVGADGSLPENILDGLKALGVGKYYLRAEVAATDNYTGLQEVVADFTELSSFEVIKAENYWSAAPSIKTWAEGEYSNDENLPVATAHYGTVKIVIVDVNDEENVVYDSENGINNLSQATVGVYLLSATVEGTDNYGELSFDTIFRVFVPETDTIGIPWWLVLIIVICSLGVLAFIFWLLHEKGVLQMLTGRMIVTMRTKATMDATIAAVRANKLAEETRESVRLAEELDRREAEKVETETSDADDDGDGILISTDEATGYATFVRYQKPFQVKLIQAPDEAKDFYSLLKNELLSYKKVKSKMSNSYDSYTFGKSQIAKLVIRGKTLCLYLALDPDEYADSKYKVERSESKKYSEVPCLYRIKSMLRVRYAKDLIKEICDKLGAEQGEVGSVNYRPYYQSTEKLLKKGLIKKITYTRQIGAPVVLEQGESDEPKSESDKPKTETEDDSALAQKEVASTSPTDEASGTTAEQPSVDKANETTAQETAPVAGEAATETTEEKTPEGESNAKSTSGNKKRKKQQGAK